MWHFCHFKWCLASNCRSSNKNRLHWFGRQDVRERWRQNNHRNNWVHVLLKQRMWFIAEFLLFKGWSYRIVSLDQRFICLWRSWSFWEFFQRSCEPKWCVFWCWKWQVIETLINRSSQFQTSNVHVIMSIRKLKRKWIERFGEQIVVANIFLGNSFWRI